MASPDRWAQLSYASFDTGTGSGGGWQVKETSGDLSAPEIDALRSRIVTNFEPAAPLPQFPTPEDIDMLPRRLTYAAVDGMAARAYWHSSPAGVDGTGRPGNVFSHVILDREPDAAAPVFRPIQSWRSEWLAPFGQQQVVEATLPVIAGLPVGDAVTLTSVIDFLLDPTVWRGGVLSLLLDAISSRLHGGVPVVLVTDTVDSAALWIGAVSFLMSPATSRNLSFSTFERASGTEALFQRGVSLVAVPRADSAIVGGSAGVVVIDDEESPGLGDLGGAPHRTSRGDEVVVTPWSVMAQVALQDAELAKRALARIDDVATTVGDSALDAAWPLAMVVGLMNDELGDAVGEAAVVLRDYSPGRLRDHPQYWDVAASMTTAMFGNTTAEVWNLLESGSSSGRPGALQELAVSVYRERVLVDREWLIRPAGVPTPSSSSFDSRSAELARTALRAVDRRMRAVQPTLDDLTEALRLADFVVASDLVEVACESDLDSLIAVLLERTVVPVLLDPPRASALLARCERVSDGLLAHYLRPLIGSQQLIADMVPGTLSPALLDWLYPAEMVPSTDSEDGLLSRLDVEHVLRWCRADTAIRVAAYRHQAILALLGRGQFELARAAVVPVFESLPPWTAAAAAAVEKAWPGRTPPSVLRHIVLFDKWDADVGALVDLINVAGAAAYDPVMHHLAYSRWLAHRISGNSAVSPEEAKNLLTSINAFFYLYPQANLNAEMAAPAVVSAVLLAITAGPPPRISEPVERYLMKSAGIVQKSFIRDVFDRAFADGVLTRQDAAVACLRCIVEDPESPLTLPRGALSLVARLYNAQPDAGERVIEVVLASGIAAHVASVDELNDDAMKLVGLQLRTRHDRNRDRDRDKTMAEMERFARGYLKRFRQFEAPLPKTRVPFRGVFGGGSNNQNEEN